MRARTLLLGVGIALMVLFALLNWAEFSRPTTLNLGWRTATAPLGLVLLGLLAITLLAFLISSASSHTRYLMETRNHNKALQAQRDLADKAEASRFTDLRQQLDNHLRETRQREAASTAEFEKALGQHQRELRNQLEQMQRSLSNRLGEMEARLGHTEMPRGAVRSDPAPTFHAGQPVHTQPVHAQPGQAQPAHETSVRGDLPFDRVR